MTVDHDNRPPARQPAIRVVFDARSGRILEVHHNPEVDDPSGVEPEDLRPSTGEAGTVAGEHQDSVIVSAAAIEPGARYRVDPITRSLTATDDELGVAFGAGPTGSAGFAGRSD